MLHDPLPEEMAERLLGAIDLDVFDLRPIPEDGSQTSRIPDGWVHVYTEESRNIYAGGIESKRKTRVPISSEMLRRPWDTIQATDLGLRFGGHYMGMGYGISYESSSASHFASGSTGYKTRTFHAPTAYTDWLFREYGNRLVKWPLSSKTCYMVTSLKVAPAIDDSDARMLRPPNGTSNTLYAIGYQKYTVKRSFRSIEYCKGAPR